MSDKAAFFVKVFLDIEKSAYICALHAIPSFTAKQITFYDNV